MHTSRTADVITLYFNSIKVRLNHELLHVVAHICDKFQFHKGTIKPHRQRGRRRFVSNFNSIKVRLNLKAFDTICSLSAFQFHKGTIKPSICLVPSYYYKKFQFHKGTIKPKRRAIRHHLLIYFNSIKVRLNLGTLSRLLIQSSHFNSIKVRLNLNRQSGYFRLPTYFNSIKVRLNLLPSSVLPTHGFISIP